MRPRSRSTNIMIFSGIGARRPTRQKLRALLAPMTERPHPPILLTNSSDIYAGGEFYVLTLAAELQRRGYPVQVACRPNNLLRRKCEEKGIPVIPIGFPDQGQLFRYTRELKRIVEAHHAGIVHTNTNYDRTAGAFAARLAGVSHVTNVHSFHSLQHNVTHWIRNMQATDRFIVDGVCVKDLLVRHDGIP